MEHVQHKCVCPHCNNTEAVKTDEGLSFSYYCFKCGYTSYSHFVIGSDAALNFEKTVTQLIGQLKTVDKVNNIYWYPSVINIGKHILMPFGLLEDWKWAVLDTSMQHIEYFPNTEFEKAVEYFKKKVTNVSQQVPNSN